MSGRTPSFIVVGLIIIMFLLGSFYMSCSSKNTELRVSLEQFEERIRSLTLRHSDSEKKLENMMSRKRELDEEKLLIQRQMEKKDSEINDLNTKLNEKLAEVRSLNADKGVLDEQLKDYRSVSDTLAAKNILIEKLQQQLNDAKQSGNDEINRLKQEYDALRNSLSSRNNQQPTNNEPANTFVIPQQRFRPLLLNSVTTRGLASLFKDPLDKTTNLTHEVKAQIVPAALDFKNVAVDAFGANTNTTTTTIQNEQQQVKNDRLQIEANQNIPAPPIGNNGENQQAGRAERFQFVRDGANALNENQVAAENSQYQQRLQRSLNNSISDNKNIEFPNEVDNENDDEEQIQAENAPQNAAAPADSLKRDNLENHNRSIDFPSVSRLNNDNYRIGNRDRYRQIRNSIREEQKIARGEEIDNDNRDKQDFPKRNHF